MKNNKSTNLLLGVMIVFSFIMFIWTLNYISTTNNMNIPTAISAFNA